MYSMAFSNTFGISYDLPRRVRGKNHSNGAHEIVWSLGEISGFEANIKHECMYVHVNM